MSAPSDVERANAKLGLGLFAFYLALYCGFVLISAFWASAMEQPALMGLNLAIVYGFALIIGALILALLYGALCKAEPAADTTHDVADAENVADDRTDSTAGDAE